MSKILVSGLINIETTLKVEGFPIDYAPVRFPFFGVNTTVSGVGFNVSKALRTLGDQPHLLSLVGEDYTGKLVGETLQTTGLAKEWVLHTLKTTPQSVILYDPAGQRMINVDLKDIQETTYPVERFKQALQGCALAVLCNINFSRALLAPARQAGVQVATDVHTIADLDDPYERDFLAAADILFMSDERLPCPPHEWVRQVQARYPAEIIVVGMGAQGALLAVRSEGRILRQPAVFTRPVVNTIGAGDALFSGFLHFYHASGDPYEAIRRAMVFASYKIGEAGAADGFLTEDGVQEWIHKKG